MSSWVICLCGDKINKNLFAGSGWSLVVPEEVIDNEAVTESDIQQIIVQSKIEKVCPSCGCLIVVNDQSDTVQFFKEQVV
ncbi:hypothetical protein [Microbulbifer sp. JTAC008]|uniref:hypothetical protein n=1 Tax=unclassified Microbulbifer TaxID=2619833 RepID=UPI00403959B4